ncbi:MAG: DUF411 domain-containing protein [Gemmatimonadales bacterium]
MRSRKLLLAIPFVLVGLLAAVTISPNTPPPEITVYKSPTCGCCKAWVKHLEENGFTVTVHDQDDLAETKEMLGVPVELRSCHTAVIGKYVIEGHVPAADIARFLEEEPEALGLTVPGMVTGSPGMEGPDPQPYEVLAFDHDGRTSVFASH